MIVIMVIVLTKTVLIKSNGSKTNNNEDSFDPDCCDKRINKIYII